MMTGVTLCKPRKESKVSMEYIVNGSQAERDRSLLHTGNRNSIYGFDGKGSDVCGELYYGTGR